MPDELREGKINFAQELGGIDVVARRMGGAVAISDPFADEADQSQANPAHERCIRPGVPGKAFSNRSCHGFVVLRLHKRG
jgi:hypothetical protein